MGNRSTLKQVSIVTVTAIIAIIVASLSLPTNPAPDYSVQAYPVATQGSGGGSGGPRKLYLPVVTSGFPPKNSQSYYVWYSTGLDTLGCNNGSTYMDGKPNDDVFAFLGFGNPNRDAQGVYGTVLFSGQPATRTAIKTAVIAFAEGFYGCNNEDHLTVAVGTNSSGGTLTDTIAYAHGADWAQLVVDINNQLTILANQPPPNNLFPGIDGVVLAVGGNNIEPGMNPYYVPQHWLDGYNEAPVAYKQLAYIIASADGCPTNYPDDSVQYPTYIVAGQCYYNGPDPAHSTINWTQWNVYYATYGYAYSMPFPEIYETSGVHADQWRRIALYANAMYGRQMEFTGALTQEQACNQRRAADPNYTKCNTLDNSPAQGYNYLYSRISGDSRILNSMRWSTDMKYSGGY